LLVSTGRVRGVAEPPLERWLPGWADGEPAPHFLPAVEHLGESSSRWWTRATRGMPSAKESAAARHRTLEVCT
jgi:hypothetical protein